MLDVFGVFLCCFSGGFLSFCLSFEAWLFKKAYRRMPWFCFPGDFLFFGLTKRPFENYVSFFLGFLSKSKMQFAKSLKDFTTCRFTEKQICGIVVAGDCKFLEMGFAQFELVVLGFPRSHWVICSSVF